MGPCFISTECTVRSGNGRSVRSASMGPCFISTECRQEWPHSAALPGFNGAVLHQHGMRDDAGGQVHARDASMGPCFISTECNALKARYNYRRCFNGAVLHQHGML